MRIRLTLLALAVAAVAPAQTIALAPAPDTTARTHTAHYPSPAAATWLSLGSTLVPAAAGLALHDNNSASVGYDIALTGLLIGPAVGYWYGDVSGRAWPGLLIRGGGLALYALGSAKCDGSCSKGAQTARAGGVVIMLISAIYDIATVGKKVHANNSASARAMVVPLFSPSDRRIGAEIIIGF